MAVNIPNRMNSISLKILSLQILGLIVLASLPIFIIQSLPSLLHYDVTTPVYLVFHNIAEVFSITVSISIFGLGWFTYKRTRDYHSLFIAVSFLTVGLIDFMHALAYSGMSDLITPNTPNKSTQFWIVARIVTALGILTSAFFYTKKKSLRINSFWLLFFSLSLSFFVLYYVSFHQENLPETYKQGYGLTKIKIHFEYFIIFLNFVSFIIYTKLYIDSKDSNLKYLLSALILFIFCDFSMTIYKNVFDTYSVLGHIYKIVSFYLIYKCIFIASVNQPYDSLLLINNRLENEIVEHENSKRKLIRSLNEKGILIRELYHRSNNTMQLIRSMINLQAENYLQNEDIEELVSKTEERIQTISIVHQILFASNDLSSISLKEYIEKLIQYVSLRNQSTAKDLKIQYEIEDQQVLLDIAVPFGLILLELISNSLKHAFPDRTSGLVRISIQKLTTGQTVFEYSDNGIGISDPVNAKNFDKLGMKLIYGIGEGQLHGKISIENQPNFYFKLEFKNDQYSPRV
ncbi:histidine kinase [Leptospira sp. 201903070]|uniref:histidine kinase n=1 Tax=Leptospira ainlahdjerensis TaxID=2810033 RepID=A0ABS2UEC7_9LEPT|nr:MASE3 domain-containing protein [Leptospira ainlahdjerensis]MBM9578134.1 histidine kinase [Leptospira ainlahdjerensis]